ncbi:hypothetical protein [Marinobacter sp.]|uniref:DUF6932 family protein n=1 Tax=Marinobacter sp. TaxID=50741 RepID=UPI0034A1045B
MTIQGVVPEWTSSGVVPPIRPDVDGASPDRSPYQVGLGQFCEQFGTTQERCHILNGFLDFRRELHNAGLVTGFQWLDGSFLERVELTQKRPPRDVDVVSFLQLPDGETQATLLKRAPALFDHHRVKTDYNVDAYFSFLGQPSTSFIVRQIAYWYSMWSHRRDGLWKGFVQISLAPDDDAFARQFIVDKGGVDHG